MARLLARDRSDAWEGPRGTVMLSEESVPRAFFSIQIFNGCQLLRQLRSARCEQPVVLHSKLLRRERHAYYLER